MKKTVYVPFPQKCEYITQPNLQMGMYHFHGLYEMTFVLKGSTSIDYCGETSNISVPHLRLFRPYVIHQVNSLDQNEYLRYVHYFDEASFEGIDRKLVQIPDIFSSDCVVIPLDEEQTVFMHQLYGLFCNEQDLQTQKLLLAAILSRTANLKPSVHMQANLGKYQYLYDIISHICTHYMEPLTADELARRNFVSVTKLNRDFRKYTQTTLHEFIVRIRMQNALTLLSSNSVADTAYKCGFNDVSHFIRTFREYYQNTPYQYIKQSGMDFPRLV